MKYTIITGENSGDLHAAKIVQELKKSDPEALVQYTGGQNLDLVADKKILDINNMAFMGFVEVLANLGNIFSNVKLIKKHIKHFNPDVILFVDYAGMNLRLAKWAKSLGFKTAYYILPKAWAWKPSRAKIIAHNIDLALSIFPFEIPFYKTKSVNAIFVGNPSFESFKAFKRDKNFIVKHGIDKPIIAIIPGSRAQEVKRNLKVMIDAATYFKGYQIVISKVSNLERALYPNSDKYLVTEDYINLVAHADYAFVTSGTASLDVGIANVPQVVIYKSSWLSMTIAKALVKVKYISLVNLICNKSIVEELIQESATKESLIQSMKKLMQEDSIVMSQKYVELHTKLTQPHLEQSAAALILQLAHA